jgi:hypothetical protein
MEHAASQTPMKHFFWILFALAFTGTTGATGQIVEIIEAEACAFRHVKGEAPAVLNCNLASGTKRLGNFWGESAGDFVRWTSKLDHRETRLKFAVRYSHNAAHYAEMRGQHPTDRKLLLLVDGAEVGMLDVPDTGNWEDYGSAYIDLPELTRGEHTFELRSPANWTTTDLDAFTLFRGDAQKVLTPAWRRSIVATTKDGRFLLRMSAKAVIKKTPQQVFRDFNRVYDFFESYMGWKPDRGLIRIHIYEAALKTGTYENGYGINFEDENFNWDRGNWIHEMNHVFDNGLFPAWTGHPMIRVNDAFITGRGCFPEMWRGTDAEGKRRLAVGKKVLADPAYRTDDPHEILYAIYAKYGDNVLRKFYAECRKARDKGEIKLTRGSPVTTRQYLDLMSRAAGENVEPLFRQWNGLAEEVQ